MKRMDPGSRDMVAHPMLSGGLARSGRSYTVHDVTFGVFGMGTHEATPVPDVSEILCGFDAIYQLQVSELADVLPWEARYFDVLMEYEPALLDEATRDAIDDIVHAPGTASDPDYEFQNESFTVRFHSVSVRLGRDDPMIATVKWRMNLILNQIETVESFTERRGLIPPDDPSGLPPGASGPRGVDPEGWGPMELVTQDINLATGRAELTANCTVGVDPDSYVMQAYISEEGSSIVLQSDSSLFTDLLDNELLEWRSYLEQRIKERLFSLWFTSTISGSAAAVTPRISFAGSLTAGDLGGEIDGFAVSHKVMDGNTRFTEVLSLCVSTGSSGDLDEVRPFVGGRNFAFALSNDLTRAIVVSRWPDLDRSFTSTVGDVEYDLSDGEDRYTGIGSARLRVTLQTLTEAGLDVGPDEEYVDSLRLTGDHTIELLRFILEDGSELSPGDLEGDFDTPQSVPFSLFVFPFSPDPEPEVSNETKDFISGLTGELLYSIYYPFPNGGIQLDEYSGSAHSAAGLVLIKANANY